MDENRKFHDDARSGKSGLALLASFKLSKRDKWAWWAILGAGSLLIAGFLLR